MLANFPPEERPTEPLNDEFLNDVCIPKRPGFRFVRKTMKPITTDDISTHWKRVANMTMDA